MCQSGGLPDHQVAEGTPVVVRQDQPTISTASCPGGRKAVSGGWRTDGPDVTGSQSLPPPASPGSAG